MLSTGHVSASLDHSLNNSSRLQDLPKEALELRSIIEKTLDAVSSGSLKVDDQIKSVKAFILILKHLKYETNSSAPKVSEDLWNTLKQYLHQPELGSITMYLLHQLASSGLSIAKKAKHEILVLRGEAGSATELIASTITRFSQPKNHLTMAGALALASTGGRIARLFIGRAASGLSVSRALMTRVLGGAGAITLESGLFPVGHTMTASALGGELDFSQFREQFDHGWKIMTTLAVMGALSRQSFNAIHGVQATGIATRFTSLANFNRHAFSFAGEFGGLVGMGRFYNAKSTWAFSFINSAETMLGLRFARSISHHLVPGLELGLRVLDAKAHLAYRNSLTKKIKRLPKIPGVHTPWRTLAFTGLAHRDFLERSNEKIIKQTPERALGEFSDLALDRAHMVGESSGRGHTVKLDVPLIKGESFVIRAYIEKLAQDRKIGLPAEEYGPMLARFQKALADRGEGSSWLGLVGTRVDSSKEVSPFFGSSSETLQPILKFYPAEEAINQISELYQGNRNSGDYQLFIYEARGTTKELPETFGDRTSHRFYRSIGAELSAKFVSVPPKVSQTSISISSGTSGHERTTSYSSLGGGYNFSLGDPVQNTNMTKRAGLFLQALADFKSPSAQENGTPSPAFDLSKAEVRLLGFHEETPNVPVLVLPLSLATKIAKVSERHMPGELVLTIPLNRFYWNYQYWGKRSTEDASYSASSWNLSELKFSEAFQDSKVIDELENQVQGALLRTYQSLEGGEGAATFLKWHQQDTRIQPDYFVSQEGAGARAHEGIRFDFSPTHISTGMAELDAALAAGDKTVRRMLGSFTSSDEADFGQPVLRSHAMPFPNLFYAGIRNDNFPPFYKFHPELREEVLTRFDEDHLSIASSMAVIETLDYIYRASREEFSAASSDHFPSFAQTWGFLPPAVRARSLNSLRIQLGSETTELWENILAQFKALENPSDVKIEFELSDKSIQLQ